MSECLLPRQTPELALLCAGYTVEPAVTALSCDVAVSSSGPVKVGAAQSQNWQNFGNVPI